jgi:secondary thiamine-phosphate synthase enzyme
MFQKLAVPTEKRQGLYLVTEQVQQVVTEAGLQEGVCFIFCPHTTAALTINSYLDPATAEDLQFEIDRLVPTRTDFKHIFDTPSDAAGHIKASLTGGQLFVLVHEGKLDLGGSQGLFLWEFDGPRNRQIHLRLMAG